jgi:hypothetical protein
MFTTRALQALDSSSAPTFEAPGPRPIDVRVSKHSGCRAVLQGSSRHAFGSAHWACERIGMRDRRAFLRRTAWDYLPLFYSRTPPPGVHRPCDHGLATRVDMHVLDNLLAAPPMPSERFELRRERA